MFLALAQEQRLASHDHSNEFELDFTGGTRRLYGEFVEQFMTRVLRHNSTASQKKQRRSRFAIWMADVFDWRYYLRMLPMSWLYGAQSVKEKFRETARFHQNLEQFNSNTPAPSQPSHRASVHVSGAPSVDLPSEAESCASSEGRAYVQSLPTSWRYRTYSAASFLNCIPTLVESHDTSPTVFAATGDAKPSDSQSESNESHTHSEPILGVREKSDDQFDTLSVPDPEPRIASPTVLQRYATDNNFSGNLRVIAAFHDIHDERGFDEIKFADKTDEDAEPWVYTALPDDYNNPALRAHLPTLWLPMSVKDTLHL